MRLTKRTKLEITLIASVMILSVAAAVAFVWISLPEGEVVANALTYRTISWRLSLYLRKATGGIPELSWYELWEMTRARGGYGLQAFAVGEQALDASVVNPRTTSEDVQDGDRLFAEH